MAVALLASAEANFVHATELYHKVLHRQPDAGGEAVVIAGLQNGASVELIQSGLLASDENLLAAEH